MTKEKSQIKARFFGMHIGCQVEYWAFKGEGALPSKLMLSGLKMSLGTCHSIFYDGSYASVSLDNCKLILRPLSSITAQECMAVNATLFPDEATKADDYERAISARLLMNQIKSQSLDFDKLPFYLADILRSMGFYLPFAGIDLIAEGWVVLQEN